MRNAYAYRCAHVYAYCYTYNIISNIHSLTYVYATTAPRIFRGLLLANADHTCPTSLVS